MKNAEPIFELTNVTKYFGTFKALSDVSLKIYPQERVALVGSSGAGKSTLLSLLNGTHLPSKGIVRVLGRDLAGLSPREVRKTQRQIGTIYQQFNLVNNLPVIHNVNAGHLGYWSFPKALFSLVKPLEVQQALQALNSVGIPEKLYDRVDQLSGGQQQRVALARVLIQNPQAILADEPVASLDPKRSMEIMDLLRDLTQQNGKTLIGSVHAVDFVYSHFDRVVGLRNGTIVFDELTAQIPRHCIEELYQN